ncbi:uncharacterized protein DEA37_0008091 [Paragonimus westermani]|uniref:17beta-estradiol 17-dehydrogenase / very-long-chain 3-oxoacyl-CoA reductase n=1 Tax=Paragonimus westermani TaxID=34504 RepID=A0A5J4N562_9TREM|nr:uncharacterized protein DEA37_0008091 [Paragonimus westermani]
MQTAFIGFLIFLLLWKILLPLLRVFWIFTVGKRLFSRRRLLKDAGEWAIVTGSTDGIGKAYAYELAKDGLNVMLISRNQNKLDAVAQELESAFNVKTKVVVCDFTKDAGEWAIVTGSTDGIGKAYAYELAKDGLNVMLISRNQNKLDAVAQELESAFNVKTKVVVCDFTKVSGYDP